MPREVPGMRPWPEHPPREAFERLVRCEATPEETREVVRHLLAGCLRCGRIVEETRNQSSALLPKVETYDAVFERLEGRLARGPEGLAARAPSLVAELLGHQAVEGLFQVHSPRRYASLALCELLLQKSRELAGKEP